MPARDKMDILEATRNYELANRAEGKSRKTINDYNEIILPFYRYLKEYVGKTTLAQFTIDVVREYVLYLQTRPKFLGHPFTPTQDAHLSDESVRDHVRTLKAFSSSRFCTLRIPITCPPLNMGTPIQDFGMAVPGKTGCPRRVAAWATFVLTSTGCFVCRICERKPPGGCRST